MKGVEKETENILAFEFFKVFLTKANGGNREETFKTTTSGSAETTKNLKFLRG